MYIAQHREHPERFLISPDGDEELWTTNKGLAYKWKLKAGCRVWCGGVGRGKWRAFKLLSK